MSTETATRTGRKSPYAGKKFTRTTDVKKGAFPAVEGLKSEKQKALFRAVLAPTLATKKAVAVDEVLGKVVKFPGKNGETEAKIASAVITAAVEAGYIAVA